MAAFKYMVDGKEVTLDSIADGPVRKHFENLHAAFAKQLGFIRCPVHDREPIVMLMSKNGEFAGYGSGPCCREFANTLAPLMNVAVPGLDLSKRESITRTKYTEMG
jgi:hypothetical protein